MQYWEMGFGAGNTGNKLLFSTCLATLLQCKLKHIIARIKTFLAKLSRRKSCVNKDNIAFRRTPTRTSGRQFLLNISCRRGSLHMRVSFILNI